MDENKKPSEGVQPDAADVESLRDKEVGSGPQAEIAKPEDKVPEAAGSLGDIADRLNAISIQQQSDSQKSEAFQRKSLYVQWCLFGATAAAFFAAAYYAGIAKQQKGTMERQVEATKEALVSVQRAFIRWNGLSIENLLTRSDKGEEKFFQITAHWLNSGPTPATEVIQYFSVDELSQEPSKADFFKGKMSFTVSVIGSGAGLDSGTVIKPQSFIFGDFAGDFSGPKAEWKTLDMARRLFFWGWVGYRDVFPNTKIHAAEFCQQLIDMYFIKGAPGTTGNYRYTWSACPSQQRNCVDEYCDDYAEIAARVPQKK